MPNIKLNGELLTVKAISLMEILQRHTNINKCFAVAVNKKFIPKQQYKTTVLQDGDCIDVVEPMAGG